MRHFLPLVFVTMLLVGGTAEAATVAERVAGRILLQVESRGEAWYVHPETRDRYYLGRPLDAFWVMQRLGIGISNADFTRLFGETPLTSTPDKGGEWEVRDRVLFARLAGRILLQVESSGEAYYLDPTNRRAYYLGRPNDAFRIMRERGLGITDADLDRIRINATATVELPTTTGRIVFHERRDASGAFIGPTNDQYDVWKQYALDDINRFRAAHGKPPLTMSPVLSRIADAHSEDMARHIGQMSHDGSLGESAHDRIKRGQIRDEKTERLVTIAHPGNVGWSGENVGMRRVTSFGNDIGVTLRDQHAWFMDEPENEPNHRTTMLSSIAPFTEVGIGLRLDAEMRLWITEDFISRTGSAITINP